VQQCQWLLLALRAHVAADSLQFKLWDTGFLLNLFEAAATASYGLSRSNPDSLQQLNSNCGVADVCGTFIEQQQ
jgi:hypothetical protein